jgi:hypothetical protein
MGRPMGVRWVATAIRYWPFPCCRSRRHLFRSERERFAPVAGSVPSGRLRASARSCARSLILAHPRHEHVHSAAAVRRDEFQCITARRDESQRSSAEAGAGRAAGCRLACGSASSVGRARLQRRTQVAGGEAGPRRLRPAGHVGGAARECVPAVAGVNVRAPRRRFGAVWERFPAVDNGDDRAHDEHC